MRKNHSKIVCIKLVHLPYLQSMTFARRRNRLTTHFSESIAVVKRRMTVYYETDTERKRKYSLRRVETFACKERNMGPISN